MSRFRIFVDTGISGGVVALRGTKPISFFRFKRDKEGLGIQLKPFITYCQSLKQNGGVEVYIESPSKVQRSLTSTSTQYIVVGQISCILETMFKRRPYMISANQWIYWVKRQVSRPDLKDPKDRSRLFADIHYPEFINRNFSGPAKAPDAITDCLGMASYMTEIEADLMAKII